MAGLNNYIKFGIYLFVFLLPWQTRWIFKDAVVNGEVWEYGRWSLYGTEIILIVILALGILRWFIGRRELGYEERYEEQWKELKGAGLGIIILIIWSAFLIFFAQNHGLAWYGWLKLVEAVGLFWIIFYLANEAYQGVRISLISAGLVQAMIGIKQFLAQNAIAANKWFGQAGISASDAGASVIEFLDQRWLRAYGSFPHPNIYGGLLAVCLLVVVLSLWRLSREVELQPKLKSLKYLKLYYWLAAVVMFFGLIVSFSRGAWLAFAIPFLFGLFYWFKKSKVINLINFQALILFCLLFGFFWMIFPPQLITSRFSTESRLEKKSLEQRFASYKEATLLFEEYPIFGTGINNYTFALQQKAPDQPGWYYQPAHDLYLLVLVELGIIGFLFYLFFLIQLIMTASFKKRTIYTLPLILCLLIIGVFDHYLWSLYFGLMLFWLVIGLSLRNVKATETKTMIIEKEPERPVRKLEEAF